MAMASADTALFGYESITARARSRVEGATFGIKVTLVEPGGPAIPRPPLRPS